MEKEDVFGAELERRNAAELQSIVSVLFTHFQVFVCMFVRFCV